MQILVPSIYGLGLIACCGFGVPNKAISGSVQMTVDFLPDIAETYEYAFNFERLQFRNVDRILEYSDQ